MDSGLFIFVIILVIVIGVVVYFVNKKFNTEAVTPESTNQTSRTVQRVVNNNTNNNTSYEMSNPPRVSFTREPTLKLYDSSSSKTSDISRSILDSFPKLKSKIANELSSQSDCLREWNLMFSSAFHGSSFPRLTTAFTCAKGPTLIVIEEENNNNGNRCVFGGFTQAQWTCVKERELHAKAAAASRGRMERTGVEAKSNRHSDHDSSKKPTNQAPQFFGDAQCFVFTNSNGDGTVRGSDEDFKIFQTRDYGSLSNANYIYYFDSHPSSDHVGLGMGGTGARSTVGNEGGMAFFIDRSLVHGQSSPGGCTTFQYSTQLSTESHFRVRSLEIWSLNPDTIGSAEGLYMEYDADESGNVATSSLKAKDNATKKALMEMNGMKMWSEENEREDV